jgi:AraC-like DNA-binding protein
MRLYKVDLGGFEPWMWADYGDLKELQKSWTQQPAHWTLFFFEHDGILSINNKPIPYLAGNVGFVVPGTKVGFDRVGEGTFHYAMTFGLQTRIDTVAVPAVADLGDMVDIRRKEVQEAYDWLHISIMRGLAVAFNILWSIARPQAAFRKSDLIFDAEALIIKRLATKINVRDLADELAISHSHLLRLFREEHASTIQEYIREKRIEIARQMITGTQLPLKEIATRTGMSDLQYFNKVIRAGTGMSPTKLRNLAIHRTRHS